jgi:hypothetical protein
MTDLCPRIAFMPSDGVKTALANLGRTEDVQFSPDDSKLAIAGYNNNKILLLDIEVKTAKNRIVIECEDWLEITSPSFNYPHGLFWIDSSTIIVANRSGDAPILNVPTEKPDSRVIEITPLETIRRGRDLLHSPGSVSVSKIGQDLYDVVICNNYAHNVSRHLLDARDSFAPKGSCRLLAKGLDVPDGISHSHSGEWIAVSNHHTSSVFIYRNDHSLDEESEPAGKLLGLSCPHGLRFSRDDTHIFVADAGQPLVHVYRMKQRRWTGEHFPVQSLRAVDNEAFIRGHTNPQEGGPKGVDLTGDDRILVASCEEEPIVFFDVRKILGSPSTPSNFVIKPTDHIAETEELRHFLLGHVNLMSRSNARARLSIEALKRMVAARTLERDALLQQLNEIKSEGILNKAASSEV